MAAPHADLVGICREDDVFERFRTLGVFAFRRAAEAEERNGCESGCGGRARRRVRALQGC